MYLRIRAYEILGIEPRVFHKATKSKLMPCPDLDLFFALYKCKSKQSLDSWLVWTQVLILTRSMGTLLASFNPPFSVQW